MIFQVSALSANQLGINKKQSSLGLEEAVGPFRGFPLPIIYRQTIPPMFNVPVDHCPSHKHTHDGAILWLTSIMIYRQTDRPPILCPPLHYIDSRFPILNIPIDHCPSMLGHLHLLLVHLHTVGKVPQKVSLFMMTYPLLTVIHFEQKHCCCILCCVP